MGADIDKIGVERAYARWAPVYDLVFGKVFEPGRSEAIAAAERICGRADAFSKSASAPEFRCRITPRVNRIVGIDLSEPMLRKAQERVREHWGCATSTRCR